MRFEGSRKSQKNEGVKVYVYSMNEDEARLLRGLSARFRRELPDQFHIMPLRGRLSNMVKVFERSLPKKTLRQDPDVYADEPCKEKLRERSKIFFDDMHKGVKVWGLDTKLNYVVIGKDDYKVTLIPMEVEHPETLTLTKEEFNEDFYTLVEIRNYKRDFLDPQPEDKLYGDYDGELEGEVA